MRVSLWWDRKRQKKREIFFRTPIGGSPEKQQEGSEDRQKRSRRGDE